MNARRLRELVVINRAITESLDYDRVLDLVVEKTMTFTGADACLLVLADASGGATVAASRGVDVERARVFRAPLNERISSLLQALLEFRHDDSFIGAPIVDHGFVAGILAVYSRGRRAREADTEFIVSALADQAAIALAHAACYREARHEMATEREALLAQEQRTHAFLDVVLASLPVGVSIVEAPSGKRLSTNSAMKRIQGEAWCAAEDSAEGCVQLQRLRAEGGPCGPGDCPVVRVLLEGQSIEGQEITIRHPDGRRVVTEQHAAPVRDAAGLLIAAVMVATDVTARTEAEQALREADRRKDEFLGVLSHELRNPLTPIRNSLYILERAVPGGEQAKRAHAVIGRQVDHLSLLVDDLLDVTRIARGKIQLQRARLELNELVVSTVEDHRSTFAAKQIELQMCRAAEPLFVNGDEKRLVQAMGKLLMNASKFTGDGGKTTVLTGKDEERGQAVVKIRDTGVGIHPDMLSHLFEPLVQADRTLDRRGGGLGLGLALIKGLVELHGGQVTATSDGLDQGTEFTVRLPLHRESQLDASTQHLGAAAIHPHSVLIIEDNVDAADSLREALALDGHTVEVAYDGAEGLKRLSVCRPEIVLCDIGLPGMSGYDVARTIRAQAEFRSVMLVAVSGYAQPNEIAKAKEAGFQHHVAKPLSLEKLRVLLSG